MVKLENDCSCCERCGNCGLRKQPHLYCDSCGNETNTLFKLQGVETEYLCNDCLQEYIQSIMQTFTVEDFIEENESDY